MIFHMNPEKDECHGCYSDMEVQKRLVEGVAYWRWRMDKEKGKGTRSLRCSQEIS
jgi:hypothetical protein